MSRPFRLEFSGALYHVVARGAALAAAAGGDKPRPYGTRAVQNARAEMAVP